jgi:branched-chain amino acid transport system ATP-binding protein
MVEQNANMALSIADRAYVLQTGRVVLSGPAAELRENELIRHAYLGEVKLS